ncbi:MAG: hypothetical protein AVDCRST_MAG66-953 [uncultured Pseudonocardia sp.]|uniref:Uncharacterized protein n=1 Tax=uncultured Pseudonocardia sp. TaxID=211455 RepID=A0A6J4NML1_9PSEU|nr:MAG: hypothetical protein AVDCRST_MAG66-953 [uncultured Pseudonocardia sp.]
MPGTRVRGCPHTPATPTVRTGVRCARMSVRQCRTTAVARGRRAS